MYSDDPIRDYDAYDNEREKELAKRPVCCCCGEHIQDEEAYYIEGDYFCNACIDNFKVYLD